MRRVENIIDMARKLSGNGRYDSNSGVPNDVFVQYLNNAQDSLVMSIQNVKTKYFRSVATTSVVSGQEMYNYPTDCFMQNLENVKWSANTSSTSYVDLVKTTTKEKSANSPGYPFGYMPMEDGISLNPPVSSGILTFYYARTPKRLAKRAGKVTARTISGTNLTALTVDVAEASFDATEINAENYLCVVDKYGAVKASNILYDSVSSSTGVFTLSSFNLGTETFSVGDYVCVGQNVINKPELKDICEGYLIKHMVYEAKMGDASSWTKAVLDDMDRHFSKLSSSFAALSDDNTEIPVTQLEYLGV